VLSKDQRS